MVDVYLLRHAHVDYLPPAQVTAHNPLTPLGHQMAALLAERCEAWALQYLFVSTMRRAQETADALSARFPDLPRLAMREFEETSFTDLEGYPGELPLEDMTTWREEHYAYCNPLVWQRVVAGWNQVVRMATELDLERVAIVAHAGPINILVRNFLGNAVTRLNVCWIELDWASTSCLRYTAHGRWVRWVNDARHIDPLRPLIPGPV